MGGKKRNIDIQGEFTFLYPKGYKGNVKPVYKCKYYSTKYTENAHMFKVHLLEYRIYKDFIDTAERDNSIII